MAKKTKAVNTVDEAIAAVKKGLNVNLTGWVLKERGVPDSTLTVIGYCANKRGKVRCVCLCECGYTFDVPVLYLGKVLSCGCKRQRPERSGGHPRDLTGWVMKEHGVPDSKLTVIKRGPNAISAVGTPMVRWICMCECGKTCLHYAVYLTKGIAKSCGCGRVKNKVSPEKSEDT